MVINQGKPCHSSNYSSRSGSPIQYIVIHYTANNGDTAAGNCNYFSNPNRNASAHYFVGDDGIYQSVPDNMRAWHCGGTSVYKHKYCRNANSIGIEMCSHKDSGGQYYINSGVVDQTVELAKYLMKKYGVPAENVIRHYDVWAKSCPEPFVRKPELWVDFKRRLTETEDFTVTQYQELKALITEQGKTITKQNNLITEQAKEIERLSNAVGGTFIYNYIDSNMPEWAHEGVQWCMNNRIIKGTGDGLNLNSMKLWTLVVVHRAVKFIANLFNVKI